MSTNATSKPPKVIWNVLVLAFSLIFTLILAEWVMQLKFNRPTFQENIRRTNWVKIPERIWTEYHPVLGWQHEKSKTAVLVKDGWQVDVHTNSLGFRGKKEYSVQKPEGKTRLVAIGDSFLFGWGVEDNQTVCAQLEEKNENFECLNLGVSGYGIDQMYLMYQEVGKKLNPDYVLINVYPEEFWRATRRFTDAGYAKPYFTLSETNQLTLNNVPAPPPQTLDRDQFPLLFHHSPLETFMLKSLLYRKTKIILKKLGRNLKLIDPDLTPEWRLGRPILEAMIREVRADGVEPIIVMIPPDRWMDDERKESVHKSLIRLAEREQVTFLDLTPVFYQAVQKEGLETYYIPNDQHWTAKGHELAAKTINDMLKHLQKPKR